MDRKWSLIPVIIACAAMFMAAVYLPDIGHGFLKDDFGWVVAAERIRSNPWMAFTGDATGTFYRPLITLTFVADRALYGLAPLGYGLTNLWLVIACAALIATLLRELGRSRVAATSAAALWLVNPHGINMSLLWMSGRTSLVMSVLSCAAMVALFRGFSAPKLSAPWIAVGWALLLGAMLSKEDAVLVPVIVISALWLHGVDRPRLVASAALTLLAAAVYLALRWPSQALTASTAPDFYRLTWDPLLIADNAVGYLDRSATVFAVALLVALAIQARRPMFDRPGRRQLWLALIWFLVGIAITVRVPVRSSLYAVFPSIGAALAFAVAIDGLGAPARTRGQVALAVPLIAAILLTPIYRSRNQRWVLSADVSRQTTAALSAAREQLPDEGRVVFQDENVRFANFADALGEGATDAVQLFTGKRLDAVIVRDAAPSPGEVARFVLERGQVREATAARESLPR